jgi:hypothetical protein
MMHVYEWLAGLPTTKLVAPAAVKIGRTTYHGASYFDGCPRFACNEPIFYLLGNVPPAYKRSTRVCWRFPSEPLDWYLAGFADAAVAGSLPDFHPFGPWFMLRQWPTGIAPNGTAYETIDQYEARKFVRKPIYLEDNDA